MLVSGGQTRGSALEAQPLMTGPCAAKRERPATVAVVQGSWARQSLPLHHGVSQAQRLQGTPAPAPGQAHPLCKCAMGRALVGTRTEQVVARQSSMTAIRRVP
jgi:hypothetical protein